MVMAAILLAAAIVAAALAIGAHRWRAATASIHAAIESGRAPVAPLLYDPRELAGLPPPVQRYFRTALGDRQPLVAAATLAQSGTFNTNETGEAWKPFTAVQRVVTRRFGFDWEARIAMMPGLAVRVHDAYAAGEGLLHASLFGLVRVAYERGTPELARGELTRFLAEAAWYPTALLPSQGVRWETVDDASATATLADGEVEVALLFRFGADGLVESVRADARGRLVRGIVVPTPWEGRWSGYERRGGMLVPLEGEVAWILPAGRRPYWRGGIESLSYDFAC